LIRRLLLIVVAVAALAAAAAACVVASAFALYAVVRDALGPAGGAAVVAGVAALIVVAGALIAVLRMRRPAGLRRDDHGLIARMMDFARDKPLIAAGAAIAVGVIAFRNPKVLAAVISAFVAGKSAKN
jgi:hypothetical protein